MTTPLRKWQTSSHVVVLLLLVVQVVVKPVPIWAGTSPDITSTSEIEVTKAAVAADDERCSKIGRNVLQDGGNAIDAAVATALCLGVVGQGSSGIGGGSVMVIRMADGTTTAIDMREMAPARASENMYENNLLAKKSGGLSIAVPGELAGLRHAWDKYKSGKLRWSRLVEPAIKLARDGFYISPYLYTQFLVDPQAMITNTGLCQVYTDLSPSMCDELDGKHVNDSYLEQHLLKPWNFTRNPQLANTLSLIANYGPSVLYNGTVGVKLVNDIQKAGGIITMNDLAGYRVMERKPLSAPLLQGIQKNLEILTMPPPSSGGACIILMLNVLRYLGIPNNMEGGHGRHLYIEALKHVFGVRENLGDWDFNPEVADVVKDMLDEEFAKAIARNISNNLGRTYNNPTLYGATWAPIPDDGTSHFSIIDEQRNAVAMTTSVNWHFGSHLLSPSTGILLNNVMDDFAVYDKSTGLPPAPSNMIAPKKRPLSSMSPTIIIQDGKLKGVIGASGGPLIIIATTRVFLNHFGLGMKRPLDAVVAPRVYHELYPNIVFYENYTTVTDELIQVPDDIIIYLLKKGHVLKKWDGEGAICQFVVHENGHGGDDLYGKLFAVSDPRKGGYPAGY